MNNETAVEELRTIRDLVRWGVSRFNEAQLCFGHGTDNALDEAAYLVLHTLGLPLHIGEAYLDTRLTREERAAVIAVLLRRINERIPAAYLTHEAWFAGQPYYVDERVIVPRSPLAELIEEHFMPWVDPVQVGRVLDLCTGSGCIAVATALALPEAVIDAADISTDALAVATRNINAHEVADRVEVICSDLFAGLQGRCYDLIISNPPYVGADEVALLPAEFRAEPALALTAGEDGLEQVKMILRDASGYLSEKGVLIVEVGDRQDALDDIFPTVPFHWLEFERGGEGVFLLTSEQLNHYQDQFHATSGSFA